MICEFCKGTGRLGFQQETCWYCDGLGHEKDVEKKEKKMKRLTTENPKGNTENMLNMVLVKNGEVYLRGIGEDFNDISLVDYCKRLYGTEIEENDPCEFGEYMDDDCLLSLFYWACVGFAEVRQRLIKYEDNDKNLQD